MLGTIGRGVSFFRYGDNHPFLMVKDFKTLLGAAFILLVLLAGASQYLRPDGANLDDEADEATIIKRALLSEGILVQEVIVANSTDAEEAFGITLNGGKTAVILFKSRYNGISAGAAGEYAKAITKAFESDADLTYVVALATNIIGGVSKKPILAWADRGLAEEIEGLDAISAYNHLNLTNLEIDTLLLA